MQRGRELLDVGRRAVASGYIPSVIEADIDFHLFVYEASGNPLIGETAQDGGADAANAEGEAKEQSRYSPDIAGHQFLREYDYR